jgi:hypothetical protein
VGWLALAAFTPALLATASLVWRRPFFALYALAVGLVLNNTVFMLLYHAGFRGWKLTFAQSWKEILLGVALVSVYGAALRERRLPFRPGPVDAAALIFGAVVVLYTLVPQSVLGGQAGLRAELYGARHLLIPVLAYLLGRGLAPRAGDLRRLVLVVLVVAAVAAVAGLAEEYLVTAERWRSWGAPRYFHDQLGFPRGYGPAGLPENFVENTTDGVFRRLVSFFLSPLAAADLFVVALCLVGAAWSFGRNRRELVLGVLSAVTFAGLLFSFTRSALLGFVAGLAVLAAALRRVPLAGAAAAVVAAALGFAALFPSIAPRTHFLASDLPAQKALFARSHRQPGANPLHSSLRLTDASSRSHLSELKRGARSLVDHPQGYGVGNSGETARRFGVPLRAGESFYLELGADTGVAGLVAWAGFSLLLFCGLFSQARLASSPFDRRLAGGVLAATVALSATAVVSDVWGSPWPAFVVWALAGTAMAAAPRRAEEPELQPRLVVAR